MSKLEALHLATIFAILLVNKTFGNVFKSNNMQDRNK